MSVRSVDNNEAESFPLGWYISRVYPPKCSDGEIRRLIRELSGAGRFPSGAAVRAAMGERFGCRGGVSRIYRLLADERGAVQVPTSGWGKVENELLKQEIQSLRERLQEAKQREERHQAHWGREIAQLRTQFETLLKRIDIAVASGADVGALRSEIQAGDLRAGRLDVSLRAFGPAAAKHDSSE